MARVGLLGTRFTMEQDCYRERRRRRGIQMLVPDAPARELAHRIIYEWLCQGVIRDASRARYREAIAALQAQGAEAAILRCTEIALLIGADAAALPLFDTTALHARAAAPRSLA